MEISRRSFFTGVGATLLAGAAGAAGVGAYTWFIEPHWLEITRHKMKFPGLPAHLVGTTVAHLSDLHIGYRVDDRYLRKCFRAVQDEEPDFVVITGDLTDYHPDIVNHATRMFPHLPHGRLGTFGVLGNHDYGPAWGLPDLAENLTALASSSGVEILRNQSTVCHGLRVIGLDDLWSRMFQPKKVASEFNTERPTLVLSHNPDTADLPIWGDFQGWILAGHTHGGQCKPPFLPPPILPVRNKLYTAGEFSLSNNRKMYINRGLGHLLQVRFNVRPELTIFTLEPA